MAFLKAKWQLPFSVQEVNLTYSKTAEVIRNSISSDNIGGYEIVQDNPTPEDIENLWNYKNYTGGFIGATQTGVHYKYHSEYKEDESLGLEVHDKSYLEKYDGDNLLWSVSISDFWIEDCFFFIWRALRLFSVLRLRLIVVLTLNDTALLFYLCDIQAADFQAAVLQHIIFDFLVGGFLFRIGQIQLVHIQVNLDMLLRIKFGQ